MSQATHRVIDVGNNPGKNPDDHPQDHPDHPQSTPNPPSQGESNFGDSSGPFFSIYSKTAEEEDNKMVDRWQKDADGILIFTGLFSAAVAALLALTVPDLRPNSQDTSAFYLGNIYGVLANPNATRASIPPPSNPPPFSPPRYTVWVNTLWFLSLVMSLSCALWATSLHQWARRYIRHTQPARCSPEKRARMRAYFANGLDKMRIPLAVEGLPTLLHLSLFLFFGGLGIFLFNVDQEVFKWVILWIGLFSIVYGLITLLPLIRHDSPYNTPLSIPAWFLYARIQYIAFVVLAFILAFIYVFIFAFIYAFIYVFIFKVPTFIGYDGYWRYRGYQDQMHLFESNQIDRYAIWERRLHRWMMGGVEKKAVETVEERSSEIDIRIFGWTIGALGDDDSLEKFFEAIPGLFNSKLVEHLKRDFPLTLFETFWDALDRFMGRTLSSNSVTESVNSRRVLICRDIISMIPCVNYYWHNNLRSHFDLAPVSIESLQAMARWIAHTSRGVSDTARFKVAKKLPGLQDCDSRWIALASDVYGLSVDNLQQHNVALGRDNVLLAALIHVSRRVIHPYELELVEPLTDFDICHTLPGPQHDFCTLWNDLVQKARNKGYKSIPVDILRRIRRFYIILHQGTDAAPTTFSASTDSLDLILLQPWSYPLCNIASHRPDLSPHVPVYDSRAVPLVTQPADLPDISPHHSTSGGSTVSRKVKEASVISGPHSSSELTTQTGDSSQVLEATLLTLPIYTSPRPTDASPPGVVAGALQDIPPAAKLSHPLEGTMQQFSIASCAEPDTSEILSTASTPAPTVPAPTLLRLHARGLVNTRNMCFVNAVLQLLVHSPSLWDLFKELGDLKRQRGTGGAENGGGATPLVDATVRFFKEFVYKEEPPPPRHSPQQTAGEPKEYDEAKRKNKTVDSFEPTYMYDVMKKKRQLKNLLDGEQQDGEEFFRLYLDALDEELLTLLASGVEEHEVSQSDQTDVRKRSFKGESVESPLMRIFSGKFRSTLHAPNQPDTVNIEDWRSLQLDIQGDSVHAIEDALARISHLQPVRLGPSGFGEASQQVLIEVLPPVLVLHLKRFLYDVAADGIVKINKPIQFAPELEIPLEIMAPVSGKSAEPVHYKLYGVLYHDGESASSGHYTVGLLHTNEESGSGEGWLHIDDESVSIARYEDMFGGRDNERVDDRCVYMLFYCRTAPTRT